MKSAFCPTPKAYSAGRSGGRSDSWGNFSTSITIPAGAAAGAGKISVKSNITALTLTKPFTVT
jgi:hypothetical protein